MKKHLISDRNAFEVDITNEGITVNGTLVDVDYISHGSNQMHIIYQGQNYRVRLDHLDKGKATVLVNEKEIEFRIRSPKQKILEKIGITQESENKMDDLTAPMPGKILKVLQKPGDHVSKSEGILVLEAMKMENVLKASADAVIAEIKVQEGDAVEKNQILITFE